MGFRENLKQKIEIDRLAAHVVRTVSAGPDSATRIDKPAMRRLLDMAGWQVRHERDLELYLPPSADAGTIIVLDNDLPCYRTTIQDVVLRKSPLIKEMISIRNVIRILNDADVVTGKKAQTVATIQAAGIARLDLRYSAEDIAALALDGAAALESRYAEGVVETLDLLAELLAFETPPRPFAAPHHHILARVIHDDGGTRWGPMALYDQMHNRLLYIDRPLAAAVEADLRYFQQVLQGRDQAAAEGIAVFKALETAVARNVPSGSAPAILGEPNQSAP